MKKQLKQARKITITIMAGLAFTLFVPRSFASLALQAQEVRAAIPEIERYIEESMQAWQVPGLAIGIVADDKLVYAQGFGVRRHGSAEPVDPDTVFQIASMSKAFLGVTQALLVDEGKVNWSDKVIEHYPQFRMMDPWVTQQFEIADLLAQRSGLPYSTLTNMMLYGYSREDIIKALQFIAPVTSFRSTFAYQNALHLIAGKVVASNAGTDTWEQFLETRLLKPLGMSSSSYTADAIASSSNWASGHRYDLTALTVDPLTAFPYSAGGAANLNSSVKDISRWLRFQINQGEIDGKRIISARALRQTLEPRISITGPLRPLLQHGESDDLSYATGWILHSTPQGKIIEHGGQSTGYTTYIAFDPDRRFGLVALSNQTINFSYGLAFPVGKYIVDMLQKRPTTDYAAEQLEAARQGHASYKADLKPPIDALPPKPLDSYAGTYHSPTLGQISIGINQDNKLAFTLGPRKASIVLEPWSDDIFISHTELPAFGPNPLVQAEKLRFFSDMEGNIDGFHWGDDADSSGQPPFNRR